MKQLSVVIVGIAVAGMAGCGGGDDGGKAQPASSGAASPAAGSAAGDTTAKALENAAAVAPDNPEVQAALAKTKDGQAADAVKGMKPPSF